MVWPNILQWSVRWSLLMRLTNSLSVRRGAAGLREALGEICRGLQQQAMFSTYIGDRRLPGYLLFVCIPFLLVREMEKKPEARTREIAVE